MNKVKFAEELIPAVAPRTAKPIKVPFFLKE